MPPRKFLVRKTRSFCTETFNNTSFDHHAVDDLKSFHFGKLNDELLEIAIASRQRADAIERHRCRARQRELQVYLSSVNMDKKEASTLMRRKTKTASVAFFNGISYKKIKSKTKLLREWKPPTPPSVPSHFQLKLN